MTTQPARTEGESILIETTIAQEMTQRVLNNGTEPNYATEKLLRAFRAIVRALVHHLHLDPQELIGAIERERDP
jgi:hypothetical protein